MLSQFLAWATMVDPISCEYIISMKIISLANSSIWKQRNVLSKRHDLTYVFPMTMKLMNCVTNLLSFGRCHEFSLLMLGAKSTPNAFFIFMRFLEWSSISTWGSSYSFTISQPYGESDYQHVEPLPSIQFPSQKLCFLSTLSLINIFNKEKKPLQICRHGRALTVILNIKLHEHI
jgi:hypothetical protein